MKSSLPEELRLSVMSSSSNRDLPDLMDELARVCGIELFDLMVLREPDLWSLLESGLKLYRGNDEIKPDVAQIPRSITPLMSTAGNLPVIENWVRGVFRRRPTAEIAALATYYPNIVSIRETRRKRSIDALANTIILALDLCEENRPDGGPPMRRAIVEIVAGSRLEQCTCKQCRGRPNREVIVIKRTKKLQLLVESLQAVVDAVYKRRGAADPLAFAIGVELEPGSTYVLDDKPALDEFFQMIDKVPLLARHVGLNFDIGHFRIAKIMPDKLGDLRSRIVHCHVSDHPGMHTRDQPVGSWTAVEVRADDGYRPYLQVLADRLKEARDGKSSPLFSGVAALELEGCARIGWVYDSIPRLRHALAGVR